MSMGYQVAFGGYGLFFFDENGATIAPNEVINEYPNTYYEPGYNIMFPVEFASPKADYIYLLFRRRISTDEYGSDIFEADQVPGNYEVSVKDATTSNNIEYTLSPNGDREVWNDADSQTEPLILEIKLYDDIENIQYRPRVLDITYTDIRTNGFLKFRINISDANQAFAYIQVNHDKISDRYSESIFENQAVVPLSDRGNYLILMPFTSFSESTKENSNFSYPIDAIYYSTEKTINAERKVYTMGTSSHSIVANHVEISSVPQYPFGGLVRIDGNLRTALGSVGESVYFEVNATSEISGNIDVFRVYLERASNIYYLE
jgi:hypothetical protein